MCIMTEYHMRSDNMSAENRLLIAVLKMCHVGQRCFRKILGISCKDRISNEQVWKTIIKHIEPYEDLTTVKRRQLKWHGHVTRSDGLTKVILQSKKGQAEKELDRQHCGVDRQILHRDSNHGTQPEGVERTDEEVRHDAPLRLFAELRDQGQGERRPQGK